MENPKNQLAAKLKEANNVLVTVSANPSVDQLAAAIGLTLFLTKIKKHATTVFSGQIPQTIDFLKPEETIEDNTDSLRDFIISLDKNKADKIRYKVEESLVKIFITPYRTSISDQDLVFSQGDFNVDVVIALGVHNREDIDQAIMAHGRILHDATVATVNLKDGSDVGTLSWVDPQASSLCEMAVALTDLIKANALDGQMATALLTGIVAETERFSNEKTSSTTMSASAKLMAAGANQQLVATKLKPPEAESITTSESQGASAGGAEDDMPQDAIVDEDGSLRIDHESTIQNDDQQDSSPKNVLSDELPEPILPLPEPTGVDNQPEPNVQDEFRLDEPQVQQDNRQFLGQPSPTQSGDVFGMPKSEDMPSDDLSEEEPKSSNLVMEPPQFGGQLSAAANDSVEDSSPLNLPPIDTPILSHDSSSEKTSKKPILSKQYIIEPEIKQPQSEDLPIPELDAKPNADPPPAPPNLTKAAEPVEPTLQAPTPPPAPIASPSKETGQPFVDLKDKTLEDIEEKVDSPHKAPRGRLPEPFVRSLDNSTLAGIEDRVDSPHSKTTPQISGTEPKESVDYRKAAATQVAKVMSDKTLEDIEEKVDSPHLKEEAKQIAPQDVITTTPAKTEGSGLSYEPHESEPPEAPITKEKDTPKVSEIQAKDASKSDDSIDTGKAESARDAVTRAINSGKDDQSPLPPLEGIGASGRVEVGHEESASDPATMPPVVPPPLPTTKPEQQVPSENIHIDENGTLSFPQNLVPGDNELPKDATAAPTDASAPPTVPPPMMPPSPKPQDAQTAQPTPAP